MNSEIIFGADLSDEIRKITHSPNAFTVTDGNLFALHKDLFDETRTLVLPAGEDSKTLEYFRIALEKMLGCGCNRKTTVVAVGGGVVGDLTGFVSACYMRGTKWINIPTTLLSQVDSSVGGKTAVDLNDYKNIVGAFHLPERVIISSHFLKTLPRREWLCGVGEIVKTAFLSTPVHEILSGNIERLIRRDEELTAALVQACVEYKSFVVTEDLYESGLRKCLNLGHTVGHAFETVDRHRLSHGEYVLIGLAVEARVLEGKINPAVAAEISDAVKKCEVTYPDVSIEEVAKATVKDKKNGSGTISVMLPDYENTREVLFGYDEIEGGLKKWKSSL